MPPALSASAISAPPCITSPVVQRSGVHSSRETTSRAWPPSSRWTSARKRDQSPKRFEVGPSSRRDARVPPPSQRGAVAGHGELVPVAVRHDLRDERRPFHRPRSQPLAVERHAHGWPPTATSAVGPSRDHQPERSRPSPGGCPCRSPARAARHPRPQPPTPSRAAPRLAPARAPDADRSQARGGTSRVRTAAGGRRPASLEGKRRVDRVGFDVHVDAVHAGPQQLEQRVRSPQGGRERVADAGNATAGDGVDLRQAKRSPARCASLTSVRATRRSPPTRALTAGAGSSGGSETLARRRRCTDSGAR